MPAPRSTRPPAPARLWLALLIAAACGAPESATDPGQDGSDPGVTPARRVVSLNPSITAILVALGASDRLVGVDDFSARQQPRVAALPRVGGLYNPSLERVVALDPDLVMLVPSAEQRDFRNRLAELDIPFLEIDPVGFDDVLASIELLGARVERADAAAARVKRIRRTRAAVETVARQRPAARTVVVLQRDPLFVIGRGSFVDEMLAMAGAENLGAVFDEPYPQASREWLIAMAPDVIVDAVDDGEPAADYWARWPSLPAVAARRVAAVGAGVVTLPGPFLDRALVDLLEAIHGVAPSASLTDTLP